MIKNIVIGIMCCLLAGVCVPTMAETLDPAVKDIGSLRKMLGESFGQNKTELIKQILDRGGDALIDADAKVISSPVASGVIPDILVTAAQKATFEEWQMVVKHVKGDEVYSCTKTYSREELKRLSLHGFGKTLLHETAGNKAGGSDIAKFLVEQKKMDIDVKDGYGRTPLFYCNEKTIDYYLSQKPDIDVRDVYDNTPLLTISGCCDKDIQQATIKLVQAGADVFATNKRLCTYPLQNAATSGQSKAIPVLIKAMAASDKQPDLSYLNKIDVTAYGYWIEHPGGAVFWANYPYNEKYVKITDCHLNITPLLWAMDGIIHPDDDPVERLATIQALIDAGADVNYVYRRWVTSARDEARGTLDPSQLSWDMPLFHAQSGAIARLLIAAGAQIDAKDWRGYTALPAHHTGSVISGWSSKDSSERSLEVTEVLLRSGADPFAPCGDPKYNSFETPYQAALRRGSQKLIALYKKYGKGIGDPNAE